MLQIIKKNKLLYLAFLLVAIFIVNNDTRPLIYLLLWEPGDATRIFGMLVVLSLIWLLCITTMILFFISVNRIKIPLFLIMLVSSIGYFAFFVVADDKMAYNDFVSLWDAKAMASEAFETYQSAIIESILYHIPFILAIVVFSRISLLNVKKSYWVLGLYILSVCSTLPIIMNNKAEQGTEGMPSFFLPTSFLLAKVIDDRLREPLDPQSRKLAPLNNSSGDKNIIVVVDESIRWDFIDLNVDNGVTPDILNSRNIVNLGKAVAYSNCSHYTNWLLRHMTRYGFEHQDPKIPVYIWDVMQNAGYENYLMDAQEDGVAHNYFTKEELKNVKIAKVAHLRYDTELVSEIDKIINNKDDKKKFIFILKKGAHFPYVNEGIEAKFTPVMKSSDIKREGKTEVINSYKNLLYHNTGIFLRELTSLVKQNGETMVIYTSDHGQNFDNLIHNQTHCSATNPSDSEGLVPMLLIGKPDEISKKSYFNRLVENRSKLVSHYDIPFILMEHSGYSPEAISQFMGQPDEIKERGFVYGNVRGYFGGRAERKLVN